MAQKRLRRITSSRGSGKGNSGASKSKTRSKDSLPHGKQSRKSVTSTIPAKTRSQEIRDNLLHVAADMHRAEVRGEKLAFTQACENRGVDPRSRHNSVTKLFYKDASSRIHARKSDNYTAKFTLPTTRPDVFVSVTARGNVERSLTGRYLNAIKEAGDGKFDLLRDFPKGVFIDGKRLATGPFELQRILEALEQSETAFEQQYYGGAR